MVRELLHYKQVSRNTLDTANLHEPFHLLVRVIPVPGCAFEARVQKEERIWLVTMGEVCCGRLAQGDGIGVPPVIRRAHQRSVLADSFLISVPRICSPEDHGRIDSSDEWFREQLGLKSVGVKPSRL